MDSTELNTILGEIDLSLEASLIVDKASKQCKSEDDLIILTKLLCSRLELETKFCLMRKKNESGG